VIGVTGEDTPDADVIVRILLRCQLPMPLTLTNVTPVLHADGAEADVTFAPSTKVALMPHSTKVVDINVRGQGRALGAVLEVTGVTANAGKNCKLRWYVLRSMLGRAYVRCEGQVCPVFSISIFSNVRIPTRTLSASNASLHHSSSGRSKDVDRLPVAQLAALSWHQLYNVLRVPLASTSSHVDFSLEHSSPALLGERLDVLLTLTSNEDKVRNGAREVVYQRRLGLPTTGGFHH
jgi:hypothetical protein